MKMLILLSLLLYLIDSNLIECSQSKQDHSLPTLNFSCTKTNEKQESLEADPNFCNISHILEILDHINKEKAVTHKWIFSSINMPNFKSLKIEKSISGTSEKMIATYQLSIPGNNMDTRGTSIWGFSSYIGANLPKTFTAADISKKIAECNNVNSHNLMPILHCIKTATYHYPPEQKSIIESVNTLPEENQTEFDMIESEE